MSADIDLNNLWLKVTGVGGVPMNGGTGRWSLPTATGPGEWMPARRPIPCSSGYHVLGSTLDLIKGGWFGPEIWLVECRGQMVQHDEKWAAEQARLIEKLPWDDRTTRLFACDCAEDVLHIYERDHAGDSRPREAIAAARRFANGQATETELAAAWAASRVASWAASWEASQRKQAIRLADLLGIVP